MSVTMYTTLQLTDEAEKTEDRAENLYTRQLPHNVGSLPR